MSAAIIIQPYLEKHKGNIMSWIHNKIGVLHLYLWVPYLGMKLNAASITSMPCVMLMRSKA